jgi:NTE family protein
VAFIEPDRRARQPVEKGLALCMSGGGYRAMLFHLGALPRLNELGYLPRLNRVSSVSGGSITAGVLGMHWTQLQFTGARVATNFAELVEAPIRKLAGITVDAGSVLSGALLPGVSISDGVTRAYRKHLFGAKTLQDLPDDAQGLNVIDNQVRSLRKRQLIDSYQLPTGPTGHEHHRLGTYWGIRTNVADYHLNAGPAGLGEGTGQGEKEEGQESGQEGPARLVAAGAQSAGLLGEERELRQEGAGRSRQ